MRATLLAVSKKRGSLPPDLRGASRSPIGRHPLGELIEQAGTAPSGFRMWLADRWPWTTGTDAALSRLRPRWAVAVLDIATVRAVERRSPEAAVRELNRALDPWPPDSSRPISAPSPPLTREPTSIPDDESE